MTTVKLSEDQIEQLHKCVREILILASEYAHELSGHDGVTGVEEQTRIFYEIVLDTITVMIGGARASVQRAYDTLEKTFKEAQKEG